IPAEGMRIHVCWGNAEMPRTTDVELKDIIDIILKAKPAGLMLMASNGRHAHEWKVFRDVKLPDGKYVIPGVLDSTTNIVEHPQAVAQRLLPEPHRRRRGPGPGRTPRWLPPTARPDRAVPPRGGG